MELTKAYKNIDFLVSDDARPVRIVCEYLEPQQRFRRLGINRSVVFFGSARLQPDDPNYQAAADLAERLARWTLATHPEGERYFIGTGGGPGIMQAAHAGGARADRHLNVGLNISLPFELHLNPYVEHERTLEFHYFFMRKFWFMNIARAAAVFPGGYGTLDELFELLTLTQTGRSTPMPVVLFDSEFWRDTVNFEGLARRGLISRQDLDLFVLVDTAEQAAEALIGGLGAA